MLRIGQVDASAPAMVFPPFPALSTDALVSSPNVAAWGASPVRRDCGGGCDMLCGSSLLASSAHGEVEKIRNKQD